MIRQMGKEGSLGSGRGKGEEQYTVDRTRAKRKEGLFREEEGVETEERGG